MIRIAVLFSRLGPYHIARLRRAAETLELTAIEYSGVDSTYDWDVAVGVERFQRTTLFPKDDFDHHPRSELMAVMANSLSQVRPEVVAIPGWGERCSRAALLWCNRNQVPVVIMSDSRPDWIVKRPKWKERVKRSLLGTVSAGLAAGEQHRAYLGALGIPTDRVFLGFDVVDNDYFVAAAQKVRSNAAEIRSQLQLPARYFLASSRFVPGKNLEGLLKAYAEYRQRFGQSEIGNRKSETWDLVVVGDGPLRSSILKLRSSLGLEACVHLPGFKQYGDLPAYYALASAFIMPSLSETWGLAVNEAMACGLPVLASNHCGCASELIQEGKNGFTFDPGNAPELSGLMLKISAPSFPLSKFGLMSREIISHWGTDRFASSLQSAAEVALQVGPRDGTFAGGALLSLLIGR